MRSRALCTAMVHVSSWNGLGLSTSHFWRVDTTCALSINKYTSYWESSLWIQRVAATAPQNSEPRRERCGEDRHRTLVVPSGRKAVTAAAWPDS